MYARRQHWPLASVMIRLRHSKIHAKDCADCDTKDEMLDRIDRDIELTGDLTGEQREKLLEIADKCPVHQTLTRGMRIFSRLV
jgi:putative redox protein